MPGDLRRASEFARNFPEKISDVSGNDRFRRGYLLPAHCKRLLCHRPQRIDVVKVYTFHFVHGGIDITRNGDVDNEKRTIDATGQHGSEIRWGQQGSFRSRGSNQDIDFTALLGPLVELDRPATYSLSQLLSAII